LSLKFVKKGKTEKKIDKTKKNRKKTETQKNQKKLDKNRKTRDLQAPSLLMGRGPNSPGETTRAMVTE
jgi:hypothetical protein